MWAETFLERFYKQNRYTYNILLTHSMAVAEKSVKIAQGIRFTTVDVEFVYNAAILHDIGIFMTRAERLGCYGRYPYITHGYWGYRLLQSEGLIKYARICQTHVGVGLTIDDIKTMSLPIPLVDMIPLSIEEKIICYADKFFTKKQGNLAKELPLEKVRGQMMSYGKEKLLRFDELHNLLNCS
ncbi:MAG: HD domain-containing protein [Thermodesulfovibrionales bacterium]|nr:HD domain-containing protein [Thermodesulfovibrionales bacterium]